MAREHRLKIGVSGIRGVVGEFLTPALACAFGQAFGTYVGRGTVLIGRDTRATGPMLQHAVERGELIDLYHQSEFYQAKNQEIREVRSDYDTARKLHIRRVLRHVDVDVVR